MRTVARASSAAVLLVLWLCAQPASAALTTESRCTQQARLAVANGAATDRLASSPCPGVRPGAALEVEDAPGGCTMNFVFRGSDDRTYAGTGGHCIFDGADVEGERAWASGKGIETYDSDGERIGETAFWALGDGFDFGLIRLDKGINANPQMCHFGGPTGIYRGVSSQPTTINFYGYLSDPGAVAPARQFVAATGLPHSDRVDALGAASFGDSGGPATLPDGRALGVAVSIGIGFSGRPGQSDFTVGNVFLVRLPSQLALAEELLGIDLKLLRAPLQ